MKDSLKVLTVDDDEAIRDTLSEILENEGFQTVRAKNGRVAMDYLQALPDGELPDVILLDYMMPVMNGDDFCKKKSLVPRLAKIPVIMMTAGGNLFKLMEKVEREAGGYLSKPMVVDSLIETIEKVLESRS